MTEEEYLRMMEAVNSPASGLLGGNVNVPAFPSLTPEQKAIVRPRAQGIVGAIGGLLGGLGRAVGPGLQQASRAIYGDDEMTRLRRQNAFQAMTLNPNQALITANAAQIQNLQEQELLKEMGRAGAGQITDPRLRALVEQGVITTKDALTIQYRNPTQLQQMLDLHEKDPEQFRRLAEAGMFGAQPGQTPYEAAAAESMNAAFEGIAANAVASRGMINDLQNFARAVGDLPTGPGAKTISDLRQIGARFGLPVNEELLSQTQTVEAAAGAMVAQQLRMNKGPQTDFDARFQATIMPGLGTTNKANEEISKYLTSKGQIDISLANAANANRTYNFDQDTAVLQNIQDYSANIPAAIDDKSGNWEYFSEYRLRYMAENRSATEQDVIKAWLERANEMQGIQREPAPVPQPSGSPAIQLNMQAIEAELARRMGRQ